jgi:MoaA/NifB/PqqE/SkfB family radical SAM enzyme
MELIRVEHSAKKYKEWVRIEWNMGKRCNFDCSYCGADLHDNTSKHMPLEKFEYTIKRIREFYAGKRIRMSLTGGEPFVHPQILDILALFKKYNIDETSIISNGSVPLDKYIKALEYVDNIIFSWHFEHLRTIHMREVLLGLKDKAKHIHVHLMYLPGILNKVKDTVNWLEENDIQYVIRRIRPMTNLETGEINPPGASGMIFNGTQQAGTKGYYSEEELKYLDSFTKAGTNKENCELFTKEKSWLDNVNTLTKNKWNKFKGWKCLAGLETLMIDNDGSVYRATCKQGGILGNIETGFELQPEPITCAKQFCNCAADLNTTKWKENV